MADDNNAGDRTTKRLRRIARIWGAVLAALMLLVLIGYLGNWVTTGDVDPHAVADYPAIENMPPLFSLLSVLGLAIAWRREGLGAAVALVFSLATLPVLLVHWPITRDFPRYLVAPYGVWLVIAIPGALFLTCWWQSRGSAPHRNT